MAGYSGVGEKVWVVNADATGGSGITDTELRATPVPVDIGASDINAINTGATNIASSQVATSTTAATAAIARPTRTSVLIRNLDTTISVYVGPATVTSANGMLLKAGESIPITWVGLIQVIAASGTPSIAVLDEYN